MKHYEIDFASLSLTADDIIKEMGYGKVEPDKYTVSLTDSLFEEISKITKPLCSFKIFDGIVDDERITLEGGEVLETGKTISGILKGSYKFALFVATAGKEFQQFQNYLKEENDMLKIFITDTIGSFIAERAGDYLETKLDQEISPLMHTNRFSPGYCGWHLTGQRAIFSLMDNTPSGISISEVCLMDPIKSISGVIGIGDNVNKKLYGCQFCELKTCYKKRNRQNNA